MTVEQEFQEAKATQRMLAELHARPDNNLPSPGHFTLRDAQRKVVHALANAKGLRASDRSELMHAAAIMEALIRATK